MVGYDPKCDTPHSTSTVSASPKSIQTQAGSNWHYVLAGFSSGCMTRFVCHPLDVLKIRFQLQVEPISQASSISKYRSVSQTLSCIVREESMFALWKGHVSAQILSGIYGMAYFSSFEILTRLTFKWLFSQEKYISHKKAIQSQPVVHFVCGSISGFCGTVVSHPFDVVRTRIISQSEPKTYLNTRHAFRSIAQYEGVSGLYRGFLPTLIQIMPFSGAQFASYNVFKQMWIQHFEREHVALRLSDDIHFDLQASFFCGALSGTFAKFLVYPLDLIKKRLQIRGFEEARGLTYGQTPYYQGFVHCIVHTFQNETISAFYKGLVPSLFKATISTALHFWLYESVIAMLNNND